MANQCSYIMQDLAEDPIPAIMKYKVTQRKSHSKGLYYAVSVTTVTFVYLLAMAVAGN